MFDHRGRPISGLNKDQFEVLDDGKPQRIRIFESTGTSLACALLLDTTGSMAGSLQSLRNGANYLLEALRPNDSVAVYTFSEGVDQVQDFTTDHATARRALVRLRANGRTALFDAISETAYQIEKRPGKKVLVVLIDGNDNASILTLQATAARARKVGVPVFAVAEVDALRDSATAGLLHELAASTGGRFFRARKSDDPTHIFDEISKDLQQLYLLAFSPAPGRRKSQWHNLEGAVRALIRLCVSEHVPDMNHDKSLTGSVMTRTHCESPKQNTSPRSVEGEIVCSPFESDNEQL